jgi:DNA-binding transcriptional MerR regulator
MRIGELAERSGVSVKALRYYERIGVLPAPARTAAGYRDYSSDTLGRVMFISAGRRMGLSLRQLSAILTVRDEGGTPCAAARQVVGERLRDVEDTISRLEALRQNLLATVMRGAHIDPRDCSAAAVCEVINPIGTPSGSRRAFIEGQTAC